MPGLLKIDNDFTLEEISELEKRFRQRLSDAFDDDTKPKFEKIAYLGYLRARREDESLSFDEYLDTVDSTEDLQNQALGGDELLEEIKYQKDLEQARFCMALSMAPSEYKKLTFKERNAFVEVLEERNKNDEKAAKRGRRR